MQVVRLKFVELFIKLIEITNCVCGRICDVAVVHAECVHNCVCGRICDVAVVHAECVHNCACGRVYAACK